MAALIALVPVALILGLILGPTLDQAARQDQKSTAVPGPAYTLVQMNLCLSGRAGCFPRVQYPRGVRAAVDLVRDSGAAAVTLNEVCRADVEKMAAELGFQVRFAAVASFRLPDDCIDPGGRGVYGIAVLTRASITGSVEHPFAAQSDLEQRRWLCVTTEEATVCTTHLEIRGRSPARRRERRAVRRVRTGPPTRRPADHRGRRHEPRPGLRRSRHVGGDRLAEQPRPLGISMCTPPPTSWGHEIRILRMDYTDHDAVVLSGRLEQ